jgi:hypothetical protein
MGREALKLCTRKAYRAFITAGLVVAASAMGVGLIATQAFTLIAITTLTVSPTQGVSNARFTVDATYRYSTCTAPPTPPYTFNFYWDKIGGPLLWSKTVTTCNVSTFTYDTGLSPGLLPPAGIAPGKHTIFVEVFDAAGAPAAPNNSASQPYTLIAGKPSVSVNPTSGLPTAHFSVSGKFVWVGGCPSARTITFKFYWYKVTSTKVLVWTKPVSSCNAGAAATGPSPPLTPPAGLNYPSSFVIQVAVYQSTGAPLGSTYTNTTLYRVMPAPSPSASPSSSAQCGLPGQAACASPSPSPAQCTAALPPPSAPAGKDAEALLAVAAVSLLPIGGIAMFFSAGLWSRSRRWGKLAAVLGLTVMTVVSATACTQPNQLAGSSPESSPSQSASPSPLPTPSCQT